MENYNELAELFESKDGDLFKPKPKKNILSPDNRLIESFEEISKFVQTNNHYPNPDSEDLKEAELGVRLNSIKADQKKIDALNDYDEFGLLELDKAPESLEELFSSDGDLFNMDGIFDVQKLPRNGVANKSSGSIATRKAMEDFAKYKPLFEEKQMGLKTGEYRLVRFSTVTELKLHGFYICDGLMCYVDEIGEAKKVFGRQKERLRVVFENGTESNMYLRTLSSQLYENGFIVKKSDEKGENNEDSESAVGYIYVLKSLSKNPQITTIKDFYKIGVTTGLIENRIKNAENDPTYLMAPVEVIETYKLTGDYNPIKVESLIHRVLTDAKVEMDLVYDDFGNEYRPSEWYSVPLSIIKEIVDLISTGEIKDYIYKDGLLKKNKATKEHFYK